VGSLSLSRRRSIPMGSRLRGNDVRVCCTRIHLRSERISIASSQRSFSELNPISASTKLMIQNRITTWLSVQPIISK
jgi:hypothetical protein